MHLLKNALGILCERNGEQKQKKNSDALNKFLTDVQKIENAKLSQKFAYLTNIRFVTKKDV